MNVVVVESPSKAKTINKYLGNNFKVVASMGHVRDLLAKEEAVDTSCVKQGKLQANTITIFPALADRSEGV